MHQRRKSCVLRYCYLANFSMCVGCTYTLCIDNMHTKYNLLMQPTLLYNAYNIHTYIHTYIPVSSSPSTYRGTAARTYTQNKDTHECTYTFQCTRTHTYTHRFLRLLPRVGVLQLVPKLVALQHSQSSLGAGGVRQGRQDRHRPCKPRKRPSSDRRPPAPQVRRNLPLLRATNGLVLGHRRVCSIRWISRRHSESRGRGVAAPRQPQKRRAQWLVAPRGLCQGGACIVCGVCACVCVGYL
jgi:hypothetical protein